MNDLISREALKKNCISCFSEWCSKESRYCETCPSAIVTREMIDNAPTVSIDWGADDGDRTVYATPTGEWIDDKCSVCGKGTEDLISSREWYRNEEPNFCPFCGVKMAGVAEGVGASLATTIAPTCVDISKLRFMTVEKKQTNEDRLKAMDTHTLARELAAVAGYNGNPEEVKFWENWLKEEVKINEKEK